MKPEVEVITPDRTALGPNGRILPGRSLNPGGKLPGTVSGRTQALRVLDDLLGDEDNKAKLREALQAEFEKSPYKFFRKIVMPLLPQEQRLKVQAEGQVVWASLLTTFPLDAEPSPPTIEAEVIPPKAE